MSQQLFVLQVMGEFDGDKIKEYDPNNKKQLKKMVDFIIDQLHMGAIVYGKNNEDKTLPLVASQSDVMNPSKIEGLLQKLDTFLIEKDVKKRVVATPMVGG